MGSWDVLQGWLYRAGTEPHGQLVARWVLSLCGDTSSSLERCWHLGCELCTRAHIWHSWPHVSAAPELIPVLTASLRPSAACTRFCSAAGSNSSGPRSGCALGTCAGQRSEGRAQGRQVGPREPEPREEEQAPALPAVGGEQAASDVTAVHGG